MPEKFGVSQGNVGTLTTTGRHGMDRVAQKGHVRDMPWVDRLCRADPDGKGRRDVGFVNEPAQRGMPFLHEAARLLVQRWPIRIPQGFGEREGPREIPGYF